MELRGDEARQQIRDLVNFLLDCEEDDVNESAMMLRLSESLHSHAYTIRANAETARLAR